MIQSQHSKFVWYVPPGTYMHEKTWEGGWYFVDEAEQFYPLAYPTELAALSAIDEYAKFLGHNKR